MKKFIQLLLPLLLSLPAAAQPQLDQIAAHLQTDRISLHYDCTYTEDTPVKLTGTLLIQGDCYRAVGNGMEIFCDGATRWSVDPASKEVYIEPANGLEELLEYRNALTELKITELKYLPLSDDLSPFRFDTAPLGPDWVVTDLR
ncbi:MAG: hypothetical protein IKN00_01150 [Bacteroidales bacterium]|nr:hypothetical protein [Bacteroidales bacterium]